MHKYLPNLFVFLDQYNSQTFENNNTNLGIIYRNYNSIKREVELIKISKACKKKFFLSPQWLRNVKDRAYPIWRVDTLFSKTKYQNIYFVNNGGWHFSNIKNAKAIEEKLKSYLHHREFDIEPLSVEKIDNIIKEKKTIYDLKVDQRVSKFNKGQNLIAIDLKLLPTYIQNNVGKFKLWLD